MVKLSVRQREVLSAAARGLGVHETGAELFLAPDTVKSYRRQALKALHARNITHAVAVAMAAGLLHEHVPVEARSALPRSA